MLGVVGSSLLLLPSFPLPAVLMKGVLEEQEEGLVELGRPFVPTSIGSAYVVLH